MEKDNAKASATESHEVHSWNEDESLVIRAYEFNPVTINPKVIAMILETDSREELEQRVRDSKNPTFNQEPAFEEGPHLDDPDNRAAKRQQLIDAGIDHDDERLTDDMRAILKD